MLTKMSPIEHNVVTVIPSDLVVISFKTKEDEAYKIRKSSSTRSAVKYKTIVINVDLHIHYYVDGSRKKEKITSAGLQNVYTSGDGSLRVHKLVFAVPGFDIGMLAKACIYISTDSLSLIQVTDIVVQVRKETELERVAENKIAFVSTWGIKCGIATYTNFLVDAIKSVWDRGEKDIEIINVNDGLGAEMIYAKLCHIQHEFGMMPSPPRVSKNSKCIITFHTVMTDMTEDGLGVDNLIGMGMGEDVENAVGGGGAGRGLGMEFTLKRFEKSMNVVGYMVHNLESKRVLKNWTKKDIWIVDHGSYKIPNIDKKSIREMFGLNKIGIGSDDRIGFVFGLQSTGKNYDYLAEIGKRVGMKIIISGGKHERIKRNIISDSTIKDKNIIFLDKFLTELEINQYALASDVLLFNYGPQDHYSVSGALHRIIGAGRPCIISDTRHFADVKEYDDGVLKFNSSGCGDKGDLERKILEGLEKRDELGQKARDYADRTSWDKVAKEHLRIYKKYVDFDKKKDEEKIES